MNTMNVAFYYLHTSTSLDGLWAHSLEEAITRLAARHPELSLTEVRLNTRRVR